MLRGFGVESKIERKRNVGTKYVSPMFRKRINSTNWELKDKNFPFFNRYIERI